MVEVKFFRKDSLEGEIFYFKFPVTDDVMNINIDCIVGIWNVMDIRRGKYMFSPGSQNVIIR